MKKPIPFGKYYLLERINVGGMAEVFRAKAYGVEGFERLVAVKRILPNIAEDKEFIKMFVDEAKIAVQLNHANIAQIFDLGVVDGHYYIALEHVWGRDLRVIFDRCNTHNEPMPIAQACFVVMKACEGLDYAHNKRDSAGREVNLVHRDVSPQNILVSFEGEVKLIDFGIAKAAGKGSKTQAGILKGKFGYMSPEQVRGLPIDRRSDVFSCGICLYELLTGERLFVGESDFSTLEKVRNVEILPPSTYNRKIPGELERIVLKALAKDTEDRYQNAIDLHDELQAFVYTAGEFYSRKDLASWMKKTFAKEIEEESSKLDAYRRIPPPENRPPQVRQGPSSVRSTLAMPAATTKPPTRPPPIPPGASPRRSQRMQAQPAPPAPKNGAVPKPAHALEWDEDELETSIYDGPPESEETRAGSLRRRGASSAPPPMPPAAAPVEVNLDAPSEPDLSSLVKTARGWASQGPANGASGALPQVEASPPPAPVVGGPPGPVGPMGAGPGAPVVGGPPGPVGPMGAGPIGAAGGAVVPQQSTFSRTIAPGMGGAGLGGSAPAPVPMPAGPPNGASPFNGHAPAQNDPSAIRALSNLARAEPIYEPTFESRVLPRRKPKTGMVVAIAGVVVVLAAAAVTAVVMSHRGGSSTPPAKGIAAAAGTSSKPAATADNSKTGFDLYVEPTTKRVPVKLDGKAIGKAPLSIRKISAGKHIIEVEAPAGFFNKTQAITLQQGVPKKVTVKLDPMQITGRFVSDPPGAKVTLVSDGARTPLGTAPASMKLDPTKTYEVTFEKKGYVTVTRPIEITSQPEISVSVKLERAEPVARNDTPHTHHDSAGGSGGSGAEQHVHAHHPDHSHVRAHHHVDHAAQGGHNSGATSNPVAVDHHNSSTDHTSDHTGPTKPGVGTLLIGSKPPCEIFVDGRDTGLKTPQRNVRLAAGGHRITLVNNEFSIKQSFHVNIRANQATRVIKDMTSRIH